ncbi:glycerophosphodiester phosphodiesterase [Bombilactobacillus apium]|uniref:glycerophosphodiester phosphodiesterase n=1 Tax=Bombilactobacillus apium TaxID=2675299 RepID=UPI001892C939|nr:glycerophosphodiester phosphodiesterase [Bombilactobacillus apium]
MSKKLPIIILLFFTFLFNSGFTVVGHRGDPVAAPEESFQSIDAAISNGAQWVELDVHKSNDQQLIISHDRNLERVTGNNMVVSEHSAAELTALKQHNGQNIYTLDQLFDHYQNQPQVKFLIETKKTKSGNPQDMEALLVAAIKRHHLEKRVMVHSFSLASLQNMQKLLPKIPRIFIAGSLKRLDFEVFATSTAVNLSSEIITPTLVKQLHDLGQKVYVWDEMNENPQKWNWLVNLPIDGVVTNYPGAAAYYQKLKQQVQQQTTDFQAFYANLQATPIWENPYPGAPQKGNLAPTTPIHVNQIINLNQTTTYLQIGTNRFIAAQGVINTNHQAQLLPYLGQPVTLSYLASDRNLHLAPNQASPYRGSLQTHNLYRITALQDILGASWCQLNGQGWYPLQNLLAANPQPTSTILNPSWTWTLLQQKRPLSSLPTINYLIYRIADLTPLQ